MKNGYKKIINDWDPIGLMPFAPDDEYHFEIEKIKQLISSSKSIDDLTDGIYEVFTKSFGKEIFNKSKSDCKAIAQILMSCKS